MPAMAGNPDIQELARLDGRFDAQAFGFIGEGLRHAAKLYGKDAPGCAERHLTATQLVEGVLELAVERFGMLAELVLRSWGVKRSEDVGSITFLFIEHGIFSKQPSDRLEDFSGGPAFGPELAVRARRRLELVGDTAAQGGSGGPDA
jgi:uncharacterized repeat protein (TIGR04138 family)